MKIHKKHLRLIILSILILPALGWLALIHFIERSKNYPDPKIPSCSDRLVDPEYSEAIGQARRQVFAILRECRTPAISVAATKNGRIIWSEAFGPADPATGEPACRATRFRLNSVSKPLTVAAMARLIEQGRLDIDADVRRYVPEFPDKGHVITARQLAAHRAGIRHYRDDNEAVQTHHFAGVVPSLDLFRKDSLLFIPGKDFHYSTFGYVLLSAVLERAAGKDFLTVMEEEVFRPLEMAATGPATSDGSGPQEARYFDHVTPYSSDGKVVPSPYNDYSFKWGGGGFIATADDLTRFAGAHFPNGKNNYLQSSTLRQVFRPQTGPLGLMGPAMGWITATDPHLRRVHFQFGAGSGGTSVLILYPRHELSVVLLANLGHAGFPMNRLFGVVNPFLPSPARRLCYGMLTLAMVTGMILWYKSDSNRRRVNSLLKKFYN